MSNTIEMLCKDCKETYWFGQTNQGEWSMYKPQPFMDWLVEHREHELTAVCEYSELPKWYDYDEFKRVSYDGVDDD